MIKTLNGQLKQSEELHNKLSAQYNQFRDNASRQKLLIEQATSQLPEQQRQASPLSKEDKKKYYLRIETLHPNASYTLHSIDNQRSELSKSQSGARLNARNKRQTARDAITKIMRDYRHAFPLDALELPEEIDARREYLEILRKVTNEGLPAHEARLKALLNQDTIKCIVTFDSKLAMHTKQIQKKIEFINEHLEAIEFNQGTYIELQATTNSDQEIQKFKESLKACFSNILDTDDAYTEERFEQVQSILNRFRSNENRDIEWTNKVTDVRQWFLFNASERYRADDAGKNFTLEPLANQEDKKRNWLIPFSLLPSLTSLV